MRVCPGCGERTEAEKCPNDGLITMDEQLLQRGDPLIGTAIGKYEIVDKLGGGGMGAVYRARHTATGGLAALKVMRPQIADSADAIKRFHLEAQNAAALHSMHTVRVLDFGAQDDLLYLVMEYLQGESLDVTLRSGPLPWRRAVEIARQVCESLWEAHTHARRIVHRDIKPPNILLVKTDFGSAFVKVIDFGIARALDSTGAGTRGAIGTPHAMAPEQWQGTGVDARTDLYAIGCVLYEMISGRPPFIGSPGATPNELMMQLAQQHMTQLAEPIDRRVPGVPPALTALICELLAKAPGDRPADAREVIVALDRCLKAPHGESAGWSEAQAADVTISEAQLPTMASGEVTTDEVVVRHTPQPDDGPPIAQHVAATAAQPPAVPSVPPLPPLPPVPSPPMQTKHDSDRARRRKWWLIAVLILCWVGIKKMSKSEQEPFNVEIKHDIEGDRKINVTGVADPEKKRNIEEAVDRGAEWLGEVIETRGASLRKDYRPPTPPLPPTLPPGSATATDIEQPVAQWTARLSAADHHNSNGKQLTKAHHIIGQDRANWHRNLHRDPEDTRDGRFGTKSARRDLRSMLRRALDADTERRIETGTPLVRVRVYSGKRVGVEILAD